MKRERYKQNLGDYLDEVVYPALLDSLPAAFPEYGWTLRGNAWVATTWPTDFPFPVEHENPDRLMVYPDRPHWIKVHGHTGVRFLDLVNNGRKPEGAEFLESVRRLCELAGVESPEKNLTPEEEGRVRKKEARRSVLESVVHYTQEVLFSPAGENALRYLKEDRGFTEEDIRSIGVGFYDSVSNVREALKKDGRDLKDAKDSAVLWDKFEGYIVVPWHDATGEPLTLYGRWQEKDPPEGKPKTMALPGEGTKASPLFFNRARAAGHKDLVAVEGIFDASLLQARGDTRVVAYVAAQFSGLQVQTLERYRVRSVTICPDPDGGGEKGAAASVQSLTAHGISSYVTKRLPDGLDPDEFVLREGIDGWREFLKGAVPGAVYRGLHLMGDVTPESPDQDKRAAVQAVAQYIEKELRGSWARVDADALVEKVAERTGYGPESLEPIFREAEEVGVREAEEKETDKALRDAVDAREDGNSPIEVGRELMSALSKVQTKRVDPPPAFSVDRLEKQGKQLPEGKLSGWSAVDEALETRFHAGELSLIAARTGHGKTSVLVGLLWNWIRQEGEDVIVFYSHEEPELSLYRRLLSLKTVDAAGGWTSQEIRDFTRGGLTARGTNYTWPLPAKLQEAQDYLREKERRLLIVNRPSWTVADIEAHALALAERERVGAVLVDYLQRVPPPKGSYDRRDIQITAVNERLQGLAVELSAPVVAGAQINREAIPKDYPSKIQAKTSYEDAVPVIQTARPELHHIREGGAEQGADLVLGLLNYAADYRTAERERLPSATRFEVGILKSRHAQVGKWSRLAFEGQFRSLRDQTGDEV